MPIGVRPVYALHPVHVLLEPFHNHAGLRWGFWPGFEWLSRRPLGAHQLDSSCSQAAFCIALLST